MPAENTVGEQEAGRRRRRRAQAAAPAAEIVETGDEHEERGLTVGKGRATPSRRQLEEKQEEKGNIFVRAFNGLREYFEGVRSEVQKVIWPTREETRRLTIIVLVALIISSIVLGAISFGFTELFRIGLGTPVVLLIFMGIAIVVGYILYRRSQPS
jgi:preprotein translocase subunit SecE